MVISKEDFLKLNKEDLKNKIVCFPTDTVYGVGCLIDDEDASNKIYSLKHRDKAKPLAILAGNVEQILPFIEAPSTIMLDLMNKYWPGALTIIFNKNKTYDNKINSDIPTIAFRIPNCKIALDILNKFGVMATTSINLSGSTPLNDFETIQKEFGKDIDYLIKDVNESSNISSTVVDATKGNILILREGSVKIDV